MSELLCHHVTVQSQYNITTSTFESGIISTDVSWVFIVSVNANIALKVSKEKSNFSSWKIKLNDFLLPRTCCVCVCACVCVCVLPINGQEWWRRECFLLLPSAEFLLWGIIAVDNSSTHTLAFTIDKNFPPREAMFDNPGLLTTRYKWPRGWPSQRKMLTQKLWLISH